VIFLIKQDLIMVKKLVPKIQIICDNYVCVIMKKICSLNL
jgi:hypothetical protein